MKYMKTFENYSINWSDSFIVNRVSYNTFNLIDKIFLSQGFIEFEDDDLAKCFLSVKKCDIKKGDKISFFYEKKEVVEGNDTMSTFLLHNISKIKVNQKEFNCEIISVDVEFGDEEESVPNRAIIQIPL